MTKAELIAALDDYPDDIVITVPDPHSFDEMSSWPYSYEPAKSVDLVPFYDTNLKQRGHCIQLSVY